MMAKSKLAFCLVLATCVAIPVSKNENGLNAALSSIANSVVVVSEDTVQTNPSVQADEQPVHLQSANAIPSLTLIALTPAEHNVVAKTEELVYSNETDAKGVVKITVVTPTVVSEEDNSSEESTSSATTVGETDETTPTESDAEVTTDKEEVLTTHRSTTAAALAVTVSSKIDKEKEQEIKDNIKEVEAMPVILTIGV